MALKKRAGNREQRKQLFDAAGVERTFMGGRKLHNTRKRVSSHTHRFLIVNHILIDAYNVQCSEFVYT